MNLGEFFRRQVLRDPKAIAVTDGELRRTYAEWYDEIRAVAGGLQARGLKAGDHFVTVLSNRYEMATLHWACHMLGAVFTPFNWRAGADEVVYILDNADAVGVAFEERTRKTAIEAIGQLGGSAPMTFDIDEGDFAALLASEPVDGPSAVDEREICLMLYTSGTTGRPKGVPRSHRAERLAGTHNVATFSYRYGESTLGVMPMFHTMGVRAILMMAVVNGKLVCLPTWDAETAMGIVEREKLTVLYLVPTMFHDMLHHAKRGDYDLSSVRNISYAGMSMTSALTELCVREFAPDHFLNFYGSSEVYCFAVCDHVTEKPGCAGRPGIGQMIRLVDPDPDGGAGPDDQVGPGENGEIIVPMDGMEAFGGYWKRPDADRKSIRGGWYFTGDLGCFDEDGELYVVGRVDDMVISGGENIHPEEVEDVLSKSPLVEQAAVIGLPDDRMGSKVVAFIEPASKDCTAEALDKWCLDGPLARFKRPRAYVFVEQIPRSASGKLLRRLLREGQYKIRDGFTNTLD